MSLFRARSGDPLHEKDTTIERCDVIVEDEPGKKSRFIVNVICRNGEDIEDATGPDRLAYVVQA